MDGGGACVRSRAPSSATAARRRSGESLPQPIASACCVESSTATVRRHGPVVAGRTSRTTAIVCTVPRLCSPPIARAATGIPVTSPAARSRIYARVLSGPEFARRCSEAEFLGSQSATGPIADSTRRELERSRAASTSLPTPSASPSPEVNVAHRSIRRSTSSGVLSASSSRSTAGNLTAPDPHSRSDRARDAPVEAARLRRAALHLATGHIGRRRAGRLHSGVAVAHRSSRELATYCRYAPRSRQHALTPPVPSGVELKLAGWPRQSRPELSRLTLTTTGRFGA